MLFMMPIVFHSLVKQNMNLEIVIMAGIQQVMI